MDFRSFLKQGEQTKKEDPPKQEENQDPKKEENQDPDDKSTE